MRVGQESPFLSPDTLLSLISLHNIRVGKDRGFRGVALADRDVRVEKNSLFEGVIVAGRRADIKKNSRFTFVDFDTVAPLIDLLAPEEGSFLATATPTLEASFSDDFSGVRTESVRLLVDGVDRTAEADVSQSGLSFTPTADLPEGPHTVVITIQDHSDNESQATLSFTTDTVAPELAIAGPGDGAFLSLTEVDVDGTVFDATSPVTVQVNEVAAALGSGTYSAAGVDLPAEGPVTLTATATDAAGNSTTQSITVIRDTIAPTISADWSCPDLVDT